MSSKTIQERIYQAQCFGNVEPIEHMVPYPNLMALVEGQNIKYSQHLLYADLNITNALFLSEVKKTARWLMQSGVRPSDRVLMSGFQFPQAEILAFGIWYLGASTVLCAGEDFTLAKKAVSPNLVIRVSDSSYPQCINGLTDDFGPPAKPLLKEEALIYWSQGQGIRLSHYNLLVNTYGVQRLLALNEDDTYFTALNSNSIAWVVLQLLLPLFSGAALSSKNPRFVLGGFGSVSHIIDCEWTRISAARPPRIYILPEAGGVVAIGESVLPLLSVDYDKAGQLLIQGHSVMLGYLNEQENESAFQNGKLIIQRPV